MEMNVHAFPVIFDIDTSLSYYTAGVKSEYTVSLFVLCIEHLPHAHIPDFSWTGCLC